MNRKKSPSTNFRLLVWINILLSYFTLFNGYNASMPNFQYKQFITCYIGMAVHHFMILGYKFYCKTGRLYNYVETLVTIDAKLEKETGI